MTLDTVTLAAVATISLRDSVQAVEAVVVGVRARDSVNMDRCWYR